MDDTNLFATIKAQLGDEWECALISTLTPGIVRLQLCSEKETFPDYHKCVEATTLEQAIKAASEFTKKVTFAEYAQALSEVYEQVMDDEDITDEV